MYSSCCEKMEGCSKSLKEMRSVTKITNDQLDSLIENKAIEIFEGGAYYVNDDWLDRIGGSKQMAIESKAQLNTWSYLRSVYYPRFVEGVTMLSWDIRFDVLKQIHGRWENIGEDLWK